MPTYAYACTVCDHRFEAHQSFTDSSLTVCPECAGRLRKVFPSVGVVFKGSGFYRNDSRNSQHGKISAGSTSSSSDSGSTSSSSSSDSSGSGDAAKTTPAATPSTPVSAGAGKSSGSGSGSGKKTPASSGAKAASS
ncbi:FmdB family zinc ribbon protein [Pengzhenrongella sp.]|uniref:FmdB family zinc ribbon protein n=1 Tax=Pengzhenrongella sp. TaxID=2888820 RepID=UPI002F937EED